GIIALTQLRKAPQRGRGLGWSAVLVSGFWLAIVAALFGSILIFPPASPDAVRDSNGEIVQPGLVRLADLRAGDCADGYVPDFGRVVGVACAEPHHIEVIGRFTLHAADPRSAAAETEAMD